MRARTLRMCERCAAAQLAEERERCAQTQAATNVDRRRVVRVECAHLSQNQTRAADHQASRNIESRPFADSPEVHTPIARAQASSPSVRQKVDRNEPAQSMLIKLFSSN